MTTIVDQAKAKRQLWVVFLTIFLDLLTFGLILPVIPFFFTDPSSTHYLFSAGVSKESTLLLYGLLTASYPLGIFLSAPILGELSDAFGRRKVLLFCLIGSLLAAMVFAVGVVNSSLILMFGSRLINGLTGGNISIAQASIADITKPEDRAKNFGLIGLAFGIGFILGPFIGGLLADQSLVSWFSVTTPFWFATIMAGINLLVAFFYFSETFAPTGIFKFVWHRAFSLIGQAWKKVHLRDLYITSFLFFFGFSLFTAFISIYLLQRFGFDQRGIGQFFAFTGIIIALTQGLIVRKLAGKVSEVLLVGLALLVSSLSVLALAVAPSAPWLYAANVGIAVSNGLVTANLVGLISRRALASEQGLVLGIGSSVNSLSQALPPLLGGVLAAVIGVHGGIFGAAIIMFLAAGYFWWRGRAGRLAI